MAEKRTVITYDVHKNHDNIREALIKEGWEDSITGINSSNTLIICHLPNTSLWHKNLTATQARADFTRIAEFSNIIRCMCYEFGDWAGFIGTPHADDET